MNTEDQQEDSIHNPEMDVVMDWACDAGEQIPALRMLLGSVSLEMGGPDMILPVPSNGYSALLIWLHDGSGRDEDQDRWFENYRMMVEDGAAKYMTHNSSHHLSVMDAIRNYLKADFDGVMVR